MAEAARIILDGKISPAGEALLHRLVPGRRDRNGAFETMLWHKGAPADFEAHYRRLCRGLKMTGIPRPWSRKALLCDIVRLVGEEGVWRVRVMAWRENGRARRAVIASAYTPPAKEAYVRGVPVCLVPVKHPFKKADGLFKSLQYAVYRNAMERARAHHCFEALLVDPGGRIIDGSRTSLLLLKEGYLLAAPAGYGTLYGLTRRRILQLARQAGIRVVYRRVFVEDLMSARMIWLANSLIGIVPAGRLMHARDNTR